MRRFTDALTFFIRTRGAFNINISPRVRYINHGKLTVNGRLDFGFLSNQLGMPPNAKGKLRIYQQGHMITHGYVRVARSCLFYVSGKLIIGEKTYINPNSMIYASTNVEIGSHCAIGWNVQILDNDLHSLVINSRGDKNLPYGPISIGDNVWIGANSKIHKGVSIGNNSVIGGG